MIEGIKMDILELVYKSLDRDEFISFLRGDHEYMVESSQYAPGAELTDVGKILARGVYKVYNEKKSIKEEYERALILMLDMSDFDVYMVCLYITSQLFKEKNELSLFYIEKEEIISKLKKELYKRKVQMQDGIVYPSGYKNEAAWSEIERFNSVCKVEYNVSFL